MTKRTGATTMLRGGVWHYRRRVPVRYHEVEERRDIWVSLHTDSASDAERKGREVDDALVALWDARKAGADDDRVATLERAMALAAERNVRYRDASQLAEGDIEDIHSRIARLREEDPKAQNQAVIEADLGGAPQPELRISTLVETFRPIARDRLRNKSAEQIRRWINPRKKSVQNWLNIMGDRYVLKITPHDVLDFRGWWLDRIEEKDLTPNSANKDFTHLRNMIDTVLAAWKVPHAHMFSRTSIKEGPGRKIRPLPVSWIIKNLACDNPLPGLNEDARDVLLIMANTGMRPSEITGMPPADIHLDHEIPHYDLHEDDRTLKTPSSTRLVPLVGISLDAAKRHPDGFPRYRDKAGWSNTVNKFLRENGLLPSEDHRAYSLRHSFEDRLTSKNCPNRIAADLMGHSLQRERYGDGASLEQRLEWLSQIGIFAASDRARSTVD